MHQFEIQSKQSLKSWFQHLTGLIINQTLQLIKDESVEFEYTCHEARKNIKKIRALLRAFRFSIKQQDYLREDGFLREIKNSLTEVRQAVVYIQIIENIHHRQLISEDNYIRCSNALKKNKKYFTDNQSDIKKVLIKQLDIALIRLGNIDFLKCNTKNLIKGIVRTYYRGRKLKAKCLKIPNSELLHSLRKSVKNIYYQIDLLINNQSDTIDILSESYKQISENLGYEHDLAELIHYINSNPIKNPLKILAVLNNEHDYAVNIFISDCNKVFQESPQQIKSKIAKTIRGIYTSF